MTLSEVLYCYVTSLDVRWYYVVSFGLMGVISCHEVLCGDMWRYVAYVALCVVMCRYLSLCDVI